MHVGVPTTVTWNNKEFKTSIFKKPVEGPLLLRTFNLDGDEQSDLRVHGGADKALYMYGADSYEWWKQNRPGEYPFGSFGENLTIDRLPEAEVHVGDTYQLGNAIVQATEPRFPCFKLNAKFNDKTMATTFMSSGHSGIYFRVLQEGTIQIGDTLELLERVDDSISIQHAFLNRPAKPK